MTPSYKELRFSMSQRALRESRDPFKASPSYSVTALTPIMESAVTLAKQLNVSCEFLEQRTMCKPSSPSCLWPSVGAEVMVRSRAGVFSKLL